MLSAARRLRTLTVEEAAWRARTLARTHAQRMLFKVRQPRWDRRDLRRALDVKAWTPELAGFVRRGDWLGANGTLIEALRSRTARFVIDHGSIATLRRAI